MLVEDRQFSQHKGRRAQQHAQAQALSLTTDQFRGLVAAQTRLNALGLGAFGDFVEQLRRPPPPVIQSPLRRYGGFGDFGADNWVGKRVLWGNLWWEVNGVPCGQRPALPTEPLSRSECEERLNWCRQYHPSIAMQCFRQCGALNTHPRTEEGRGCRHLPNLPGQSSTLISTAAGGIGALAAPNIDELDPETLATILINNPVRYAAIIAWATAGLAITLPIITAQAITRGRNIGQLLESIGGVLIAPAIPAVLALGITLAVRRGGWEKAWEKIIGPGIELVGDVANAIIAFLTGGPIAAFAAGMRFLAKKITDGFLSAVMQAIADTIGVIVQAINGGIEFLKQSTLYNAVGNALAKIGRGLSVAAGGIRDVIISAGTALASFAQMIASLLQGDLNGAKNEAVKQALGVDMATLDKTTASDRARLIVPNQPVLGALNSVVNIVKAIINALAQAAKFLAVSPLLNFLNSLGGSIGDFVNGVLGFIGGIVPGPGPKPPTPEELAKTIQARDATIAELQAKLAKESQARVAAESALVVKSQDAQVYSQRAASAEAEAAALAQQQAEQAEKSKSTGTALAIAAAAAAFLT